MTEPTQREKIDLIATRIMGWTWQPQGDIVDAMWLLGDKYVAGGGWNPFINIGAAFEVQQHLIWTHRMGPEYTSAVFEELFRNDRNMDIDGNPYSRYDNLDWGDMCKMLTAPAEIRAEAAYQVALQMKGGAK